MPEPTKIPRPFADSGDKNSIPDSSGGLGFASWQEGFPAITGTPFAQGGVAPKRADFNGVFNALSAATVWNQQGGVYAYDATTDYEVGNVVEYSGDLYKCITANGPSSAIKAPTDTTVWDAIATASGYLPLSGGTLTGTTNAPTPATSDNSTKIATTAYMNNFFVNGIKYNLVKTTSLSNGQSFSFGMGAGYVAVVFAMRGNASKVMMFDVWDSAPVVLSSVGTLNVTGSMSGNTVTVSSTHSNAVVCLVLSGDGTSIPS